MGDEKFTNVRQGYNPGPLSEAVLQKGLNPAPLSQAVQQLTQGSNPAPTPDRPNTPLPQGSGNTANPK